jgi:hypothetical protein
MAVSFALIIGGAARGIRVFAYFLADWFVSPGLALRGLPFPGTTRIASMADLSYKTSLVTGFIPALKSRCFAAKYVISRSLAISDIVKYSPLNFILSLSVNVLKRLNFHKCLNRRIGKLAIFEKKMYFPDTFSIDFNVS